MTEKSASTTASTTPAAGRTDAAPEVDDQTHRVAPRTDVPAPPEASEGAADGASSSEPPPPAPPTTGASPVKDGAVKAAAAALAAARSAAKKVQSAVPDGTREDAGGGAPVAGGRAPGGTSAERESADEPLPEMHYSAGSVHGTAAAAGAPAGAVPSGPTPEAGPRRVRLSISRIDPWSVMKLAFLLSVAIGFMIVVATMVVWYVLNDMGTFATIQDFLQQTVGPQTVNIVQFIEFDRVVSLSVLIAIIDVVLLTAVATILAILYNITAALVGGVHLTLTDE